jgi:hypothetical protein
MDLTTLGNSATLRLQPGERYHFKNAILTGHRNFNTCVSPPHPGGSPIARIIHRCYFGMKVVEGGRAGQEVSLTGYYPQGEFYALTIPAGERHYVNLRNLVGFCDRLASIHTRIRFSLPYWCLAEHFFPVFEGPATLLLYSRSRLERSAQQEYAAERIVSFNVRRRFRPTAPTPTSFASMAYEISLSKEVIWHFLEPGETIVETYQDGAAGAERISLKEILIHLLGLYRF